LELQPRNLPALRGLATIYFETEKWEKAKDYFDLITSIRGEAIDYYFRGKCLYKLGKTKNCCDDLTRAAQMGYPQAEKDKLLAGCQ
jgi:tetratricopeptide (TPR) repeat protein